jgi:hypothetical protein
MLTIVLECTKIHANASRHRAFVHERRAGKIEAHNSRPRSNHGVLAEATHRADIPCDGMSSRTNWPWREEERLAKIAEAKVD